MGVYINMEMPKTCYDCKFRKRNGLELICPVLEKSYKIADTQVLFAREKDCPLIEVPEPHGDLIDASEKIRVQMYDDEHEDFHTEEMTIDDLLSQSWVKAYAFPVIPASESKERPAFLPTYELTPRREEAE